MIEMSRDVKILMIYTLIAPVNRTPITLEQQCDKNSGQKKY